MPNRPDLLPEGGLWLRAPDGDLLAPTAIALGRLAVARTEVARRCWTCRAIRASGLASGWPRSRAMASRRRWPARTPCSSRWRCRRMATFVPFVPDAGAESQRPDMIAPLPDPERSPGEPISRPGVARHAGAPWSGCRSSRRAAHRRFLSLHRSPGRAVGWSSSRRYPSSPAWRRWSSCRFFPLPPRRCCDGCPVFRLSTWRPSPLIRCRPTTSSWRSAVGRRRRSRVRRPVVRRPAGALPGELGGADRRRDDRHRQRCGNRGVARAERFRCDRPDAAGARPRRAAGGRAADPCGGPRRRLDGAHGRKRNVAAAGRRAPATPGRRGSQCTRCTRARSATPRTATRARPPASPSRSRPR